MDNMDNMTLRIDPVTHDLVLDKEGSLQVIGGAETVAQCVRLTLETFKGEWFLDPRHGTAYEEIIGDASGDPEAVLREAIYQEDQVRYIDELKVERKGREISAAFSGRLQDGTPLYMEVTA